MKTLNLFKSAADPYRRKIVIAEINILRNFEGRQQIQEKIDRELRKLHSLWFRGSTRDMS